VAKRKLIQLQSSPPWLACRPHPPPPTWIMVAELACSLLPVTLNDDGLVETNWDEGELQLIEPPAAACDPPQRLCADARVLVQLPKALTTWA